MHVSEATPQMLPEITGLLQSQSLPVEDLSEDLNGFLVATDGGSLVGVIGVEIYGNYGLLRSMAVHPDYRNRAIAAALAEALEYRAKNAGVKALYLLTETAQHYFTKKGFSVITRETVPDEVKKSAEFSHVCPVSAIVMTKQLI
ncbi:GNAT family N-acetyltransferase [Pseudoflavitalea sp. G-6-1-2]|uniref:arsenic resistance N-acetyltransferase ArsN2 n=1 Tax=Pseudoflavitalea sp. G-6-1-2 TaxID=2728841 RepID=UPI00146CD2A4|nr:arsenic resistance N-acetyltransferase ArsN2 [Pseudoflavitalea sp. G-6-1-2]NML22411.1 GNAT family N-acetyltransferase [Pseudoflavitalea sp. G-6-1-2]